VNGIEHGIARLSKSNRCSDVPIAVKFEDTSVLRIKIRAPDPHKKEPSASAATANTWPVVTAPLDASPLPLELSFRVKQL
jgi:hypothetical protein